MLEKEAEADWMQAVAAEMNLSETAFVAPLATGFGLRWFTPATEVDLCGHGALGGIEHGTLSHAQWHTYGGARGRLD